MSKLRDALRSNDNPVDVASVVVMLVSAVASGLLGHLWDPRTTTATALLGAVLGLVVTAAPMRLALRLILLNGVMLALAVVLGMTVSGHAAAAAIVVALFAFVTSVWSAVPVAGVLFAGLPVLVLILVVAEDRKLVGTAGLGTAVVAALLAMAAPAVLAVLLSIRDPRKFDRTTTGGMYGTKLPAMKRLAGFRVLLLNSAPNPLPYLAARGTTAAMCRSWLKRRGELGEEAGTGTSEDGGRAGPAQANGSAAAPPTSSKSPPQDGAAGDVRAAAAAQAEANGAAIAAALLPKGPITPRHVDVEVDALNAAADAARADGKAGIEAIWRMWAQTYSNSAKVLAGDLPKRLMTHPTLAVVRAMIKALVSPDVSVFRYGVQRALALGVAAFLLVRTGGSQSMFWITLTLTSVMQVNAPATTSKMVQRCIGTFIGAGVAAALAVLLPIGRVYMILVALAFAVGLAYMKRNYVVMAAMTGFAMVLVYGAPDGRVGQFAGMRALDVLVGGLVAWAVAHLVLPVRADPQRRRTALAGDIDDTIDLLRRRLADPASVTVHQVLNVQSRATAAASDYDTDIDLIGDPDLAAACRADLGQLWDINEQVFVLGTIVLRVVDDPTAEGLPTTQLLDTFQSQVREVLDRPLAAAQAPAGSSTTSVTSSDS